jgi:hypothetical protein
MKQMYTTKKCIQCGKTGTVELHMDDVLAWHRGRLAQQAFPYLDKEEREQVISGTHPACWTLMVGHGQHLGH